MSMNQSRGKIACRFRSFSSKEALTITAKVSLSGDKLCGVTVPVMTGQQSGIPDVQRSKAVWQRGHEMILYHTSGSSLCQNQCTTVLSERDAQYRDIAYHSDVHWFICVGVGQL